MPYLLNNAEDRAEMLKTIGVESVEDLFSMVPPELRLDHALDLPPALGELELTAHMSELAAKNDPAGAGVCFLGGGSYDHFIPAVVDFIASRSEFVTSYTPYQPEVSQGNLQALFEYQTLITQLTGMDYSNSSLYDGGSAVAEGVLMAMSVTRRPGRVLVARSVHPDYRQILATYLANLDVELVMLDTPGGTLDPAVLRAAVNDETACLLMQQPNFFGCVEKMQTLADIVHDAGASLVASVDPISLGLLKRPGDGGADIVVAEGQSLGTPMQFGGPYLGILAVWREVSPPHAGPPRRPDSRSPRTPLLGADPADPRAAHPPRQGHQQHLHEPGPAGGAGGHLSGHDGAGRAGGCGQSLPAKGPLRGPADDGKRPIETCLCPADVQGVRHSRGRWQHRNFTGESAGRGHFRRAAAGPLVS